MMVTSKVIMRRERVRFTYSDYLLLPEDKRYEILDGDIYVVAAPNIRHQSVALNLEVALFQHMKETGLGSILHAPCDVILSEENVVQPDILFVRKERAGIVGESNLQGPPDIVIEILSEGTRRKDLEIKKKIYAQFAVPEYWIVDPEANTVEVLLSCERGYVTAGVYGKQDSLSSPTLPDFKLALTEIF
jgi:Uma2 family endonuclease